MTAITLGTDVSEIFCFNTKIVNTKEAMYGGRYTII